MFRFNTLNQNTTNPTGLTFLTAQYHIDPPLGSARASAFPPGHRIITGDGSYFDIAPQDKDKQFQRDVPVCKGATSVDLRQWYKRFIVHACQYGICVHPYYCFRSEADSDSGFTCGNDSLTETFDLPVYFSTTISDCSTKICTAISKDKISPKGNGFIDNPKRTRKWI